MQENNWNQQYQPPYGQQGPEQKGFAIASLVLGILRSCSAVCTEDFYSAFPERFWGSFLW